MSLVDRSGSASDFEEKDKNGSSEIVSHTKGSKGSPSLVCSLSLSSSLPRSLFPLTLSLALSLWAGRTRGVHRRSRPRIQGLGLGFGVWGWGLGVGGLGFGEWGLELGVWGLGIRDWCLEFRFQG